MRLLSFLIPCAAVFFLCASASAQRVNLPQSNQAAALPEEEWLKLEDRRTELTDAPLETLTRDFQATLLGALPGDLRQACGTVLGSWGTVADGTARWTVKALFRYAEAERLSVLLSYRCGSSYADYAEYYDERLAVLSLDAATAFLQFIPLAKDCERCSDLYHIEYSQPFPFENGRLVELKITSSSNNPCCDGPEAWSEEQFLYLALPDSQPALSLPVGSQRWSHDDVEGDTEETCRSDLGYDLNDSGYLRGITSRMTCRIEGGAMLTQEQRYRWRPELRRFEQVSSPQP